MATIVLGIGTSHGPMLSTPPEEWGQRVKADQTTNELYFMGERLSFEELARRRACEGLEREVTLEKMRERHAACQRAIAHLAETLARVAPDVAVIIGDDQEETFFDDNMPAFLVYWGEKIENVPLTPEQAGERGAGLAVAAWGHSPPELQVCDGVPSLGRHIIEEMIRAEFDVSHSRRLPAGRFKNHTIPHAFGFIYRRIMNDDVIPNVPIFINTFYPPNQPSLRRCYAFGKVLGRAISSWESDQRVAVIASGGLSHFVIEEDLDQDFLEALRLKDDARLTNLPVARFNAGSSEMRNWIALAGALAHTDLQMHLVDYVPCYRSAAGTGNAMGFAEWL